jgi:phosphohistidine swiveling domain-containing protein
VERGYYPTPRRAALESEVQPKVARTTRPKQAAGGDAVADVCRWRLDVGLFPSSINAVQRSSEARSALDGGPAHGTCCHGRDQLPRSLRHWTAAGHAPHWVRRAGCSVRAARPFLDRVLLALAQSGPSGRAHRASMPEQETAEPRGPIEGSALVEGVAIGRAVVWGSDPAEDAVTEAASRPSSRLTVDARARPFVGLAHGERSGESSPESRDGHRVLVTSTLTPSVVAALPVRVVGILAAPGDEGVPGGTSHAVILARARGIPLVRVRPEAIEAVRDDDTVVLDATRAPALVWLAPRAATVSEAWSRRESWARARLEEPGSVATRLDHLGVKLCVSVSSFDEHIPAAAEGVGLLRTELVFFRRARAPSVAGAGGRHMRHRHTGGSRPCRRAPIRRGRGQAARVATRTSGVIDAGDRVAPEVPRCPRCSASRGDSSRRARGHSRAPAAGKVRAGRRASPCAIGREDPHRGFGRNA